MRRATDDPLTRLVISAVAAAAAAAAVVAAMTSSSPETIESVLALTFRLDLRIIIRKNTVICSINCVGLSFHTHFYSCIFHPLYFLTVSCRYFYSRIFHSCIFSPPLTRQGGLSRCAVKLQSNGSWTSVESQSKSYRSCNRRTVFVPCIAGVYNWADRFRSQEVGVWWRDDGATWLCGDVTSGAICCCGDWRRWSCEVTSPANNHQLSQRSHLACVYWNVLCF